MKRLDDLETPVADVQVALKSSDAVMKIRQVLLEGKDQVRVKVKAIRPRKGVIETSLGNITMVKPEKTSPLRALRNPRFVLHQAHTGRKFVILKMEKELE